MWSFQLVAQAEIGKVEVPARRETILRPERSCCNSRPAVFAAVTSPDTVAAVIGLGSLGILFPPRTQDSGASRVVGIDRIDRSDEMSAFDLDQAVCSDSADWSGRLRPEDKPGLVMDAVGHGIRVLAHSVDAAAPDGTIVSFGVPDSGEYVFPLLSFFRKNLRMVAGAGLPQRSLT